MKKRKEADAPIVPPTGSIPPIHTSQSLETAVTISAFVIAMMVGLYVLLMLAWGWLTVRFLMALPDKLDAGPIVMDVLWYTLAAIVVIVLIFLIKPLLPLRRKPAPPIELTEADQPELFAYIRALAKCIDAPEPDRVLVDVHANASASFAGGMSPTSGPLTLTLGLPLIGGMTVRQLAGVIAHELGHFSQGSMVKQNIVIGFVSGWLTEVALGEDRFDRIIHGMAVSAPPVLRHVFKIIRLVTNAIRRVFYVVMIVGHLVTRMAARQLEYDADQYMAHTTGSKHFAETMRETIVLGHAGMQAIEDAQRFYRDRRLPNDLPAMVVTRAHRMDDKQRKKLISGEDQGEVEAFSTHPLTGKRIEKALALNSKGLVHDDRPARGLFRDFEKLCKDASEALYKEVIGKEYDAKHLTDSTRLIAELEATDKARKAAQRFCQSDLLLMLPVFPTTRGLRMPESPQKALDEIREMRQRAQQMRDQAYPLMRKLDEAHDKLMNARQGHLATQAGFQIRDFKSMGLEAGDLGGLSRSVADQGKAVDDLENRVRAYNADLIKRMELDFALLKHPKVTERIGQERADKIWREIEVLVPAGQALASVQDAHENLRVQGSILAMGVHLIMQGLISYQLIEKIKQTAKETTGEIKDILRSLASRQYPFAHGDGKIKMAEAVCEKPPDEDNLGDILFVADDISGRLFELRERIMGRLCHHAERIEKVMGLKPLPAPEEADALDELLEKIGVDDTGPVQNDAHSTKGLVGALLVQGVMGVAVLGLSGVGVYATLPQAPGDLADDTRAPQVALDDPRDRDADTARPDRTPSGIDRTRPERDDRSTRPDRPTRPTPTPEPTKPPSEWTADESLERMASSRRDEQLAGMRALLDNDDPLSDRQAKQAVAYAVKIIDAHARSAHLLSALEILSKHAPDKGLRALSPGVRKEPFFVEDDVVKHIGSIDDPKAADLLALLAQELRHRVLISQLFGSPPMEQYAEDAMLQALTGSTQFSTNEKRAMLEMLGKVATKKSSAYVAGLLNDPDIITKRYAAEIIERIDPQVNDAAVRFLRSIQLADSRASLWRELSDLAESPPEDGDPRRKQVSQALVRFGQASDRRIDHRLMGALAAWGDETAVPLYLDMLEDEDTNRAYVKTAIQSAGAQTDDRQAGRVADAISNWFLLEPDAVAQALVALGEIGEGPAMKNIDSKHAKVRLACIEVLRGVGTSRGLAALRGMGKDSDPTVKDAAREAYYELRDKLKAQNE